MCVCPFVCLWALTCLNRLTFDLEKNVWINKIHAAIFYLVKTFVKIDLVDPEIIWLKLKK